MLRNFCFSKTYYTPAPRLSLTEKVDFQVVERKRIEPNTERITFNITGNNYHLLY